MGIDNTLSKGSRGSMSTGICVATLVPISNSFTFGVRTFCRGRWGSRNSRDVRDNRGNRDATVVRVITVATRKITVVKVPLLL